MDNLQYDLAALGEALIDFTYEGENAQGQKLFAQNPGGAPANVAAAAAKLGAKTAFLGKAGADMHGEFLKETLSKLGVDTSGFLLDSRYFTTLAFVGIGRDGERSFSFARKPGADTAISWQEIKLDIIKSCRVFHLGSLSLTDEPARSAAFYAVKQAKKAGAIISYDPNYRASLWQSEAEAKQRILSLLPYVDMIKVSEEETALLTSAEEPSKAADWLIGQGVKLVCVTMGACGAYVRSRQGGGIAEGFSCKPVDATGAGDAFWGAFLSQLAASGAASEKMLAEMPADTLLGFARFANAAASLCVEAKGAIPAMPTRQAAEERCNMTQVVAALIWERDKFLICKRPSHKARGLYWEFAGGKVEKGETKQQALIRECREELGIAVEVHGVFMELSHEYPDLKLQLTLYNVTILSGRPQRLEHEELKWITPDEIPDYAFCPADEKILKRILEQS